MTVPSWWPACGFRYVTSPDDVRARRTRPDSPAPAWRTAPGRTTTTRATPAQPSPKAAISPAAACDGYTAYSGSDRINRPCPTAGTEIITAGCAHEHVGDRRLCVNHASDAQAGEMLCGECLDNPSSPHRCHLRVIDRHPAPSRRRPARQPPHPARQP